jgi:hypothetical protein
MNKYSAKNNLPFYSLFLAEKTEAFIPKSEGFSFSVRDILIRLRLASE